MEDNLSTDTIAKALVTHGSVVFNYNCPDKMTAYNVLICKKFVKLNIMHFGGNPHGRFYVGLQGKGCDHLDLDEHWGYIAEKLTITRDNEAAEQLGLFLNKIFQSLKVL